MVAKNLERAKGVEPSSLAWEAKVMPLYDARVVGCEILSGFPARGKSHRIRHLNPIGDSARK